MTRYVLLTEFYPPQRGGIQASLEPLVQALGDEVTVVAPVVGPPGSAYLNRSLFSGRGWPRWWWLVSWLRRQRQDGLDYIIFGHFSAATLAIMFLPTRLRYAILVHGNDLLNEQRRWYVRPFIGWVLRRATFIGVNSAYVESLVHRYTVPLSRIVFTHPAVVDHYVPAAVPTHGPGARLITIGRLVKRKNVRAILEAIPHLLRDWPDIHLDVVGEGPERQPLVMHVERLGVSARVTFHGDVPDETKRRLLEQATIFVMVPLLRDGGADVEGLGLVYLEAAAAGLPIVASDTGGVTDIVTDGQTGIIVPPTDAPALAAAVQRLLREPDLAAKYARQAQDRVRREFTVSVRAGRALSLIRGIEGRPLVSVIIPAYQSARTIGRTLRSVRAQSYRQLEVIVVDDGSTDNLEVAVKPFKDAVVYVKQTNAGAPAARNTGFALSHGEFVLFLDADITLVPTAIGRMLVTLQTHSAPDFAYSDFTFGWKHFGLQEFIPTELWKMNFIHTSSLIRRAAFPGFDEGLKRFQDWDLWLTMLEQGRTGIWIPETLFHVEPRDSLVGMSTWLPSFVYRLPFIGRGQGSDTTAKYRAAEAAIRAKHRRV